MLVKEIVTPHLWDDRSVEEKREVFIRKYLQSDNKKVLYLHVPFCKSKCKYCICETQVSKNDESLQEFVFQTLKKQIEDYHKVLETVDFDELYIGGGTPTILDASLMEEVFQMLPCVEKIPLKSVECSPHTLTFEHLELFKKYSFSFLSMGIQSLQENVCKWQNRYYVSRTELRAISDAIRQTGIYFNYDMISYLGKGDIRDLPGFRQDMKFIMEYCKPTSICVHQHHQIEFSTEKTRYLIKTLRELMEESAQEYECVNSLLLEEDVEMDTMYQAQYRLVRDQRDFCHYMWKRFPMIPVKGYDVLGLGFMNRIHVKSNVKELVFAESRNQFTQIEYQDFVYEDFQRVRELKGLKKGF